MKWEKKYDKIFKVKALQFLYNFHKPKEIFLKWTLMQNSLSSKKATQKIP